MKNELQGLAKTKDKNSYMTKSPENNDIQRVMVSYKEIFSLGIQCFHESHNHFWRAKRNNKVISFLGKKYTI